MLAGGAGVCSGTVSRVHTRVAVLLDRLLGRGVGGGYGGVVGGDELFAFLVTLFAIATVGMEAILSAGRSCSLSVASVRTVDNRKSSGRGSDNKVGKRGSKGNSRSVSKRGGPLSPGYSASKSKAYCGPTMVPVGNSSRYRVCYSLANSASSCYGKVLVKVLSFYIGCVGWWEMLVWG